MMMPCPTRRRAAACATLLTFALFGACNRGGDAAPEQPQAGSAAEQSADAAAAPTSTVTIGLTGLILMLPVSNPAGATRLFMPNIQGHVAYVGFYRANSADCDKYNTHFKICFMSLENSELAPIGMSSTTPGKAPSGVVHVSQISGSKGQATSMELRSRTTATLHFGASKDPCPLARWTIDPYPAGPPLEEIDPANVLTWEIPNVQGSEIDVARTPLSGVSPPAKSFKVPANQQGRIELLIVHIPKNEFLELENAKPGPGPGSPALTPDLPEINQHLSAFYNLIGAAPGPHAYVSAAVPTGKICRLPVLGLQNAVYPLADSSGVKLTPQSRNGVRTYSCVIATAEEG